MDIFVQKARLLGQVIEDLSYAALEPDQYKVELAGIARTPQYKKGGYFAFSDLQAGEYTLRITGQRFQSLRQKISIPLSDHLVVSQPGDNDLILIATGVSNGGATITFDPVIVTQAINAGGAVIIHDPSQNPPQLITTKLAKGINVGRVVSIKVEQANAYAAGALVRIVRAHSIRMRFNPYTELPVQRTRIVGKVAAKDAPKNGLPGARVELTGINQDEIASSDVDGVTVKLISILGTKAILGTQHDLMTITNESGDYNLYFYHFGSAWSVNLSVTLDGYHPQTKTLLVTGNTRYRADFQLE